ncbi:MAG: serine hydrolase domain-containing protein, partial [Bacteroidia bacterium]|nr:serine hydrolase domain-containing protein [Bacteroidia bacterium]
MHHKGYGLANRNFGVVCGPDTRYAIGELTQCFTAVLALQLIEARKLQLDTRVAQVLREYQGFAIGAITVQQLMQHSSGLASYTDAAAYQRRTREVMSPLQLIEMVKYTPLSHSPGTQFRYSPTNYLLLGLLLERVAGMPYAQLLQEKILQPCGMNSSGMLSATEVTTQLATGYRQQQGRYSLPPYH